MMSSRGIISSQFHASRRTRGEGSGGAGDAKEGKVAATLVSSVSYLVHGSPDPEFGLRKDEREPTGRGVPYRSHVPAAGSDRTLSKYRGSVGQEVVLVSAERRAAEAGAGPGGAVAGGRNEASDWVSPRGSALISVGLTGSARPSPRR